MTAEYDKFGRMALDYQVGKKVDMIELKKQLYLAMNTVNLLEGLRFYVSFACTFAFGELKLMEGSAKILSLIARHEATHLNLSTHVLKAWHKGDDAEMTKAIKGTEKTVIQMFKDCVEEEKAWARYLFKDGSIIGLNEKLLGIEIMLKETHLIVPEFLFVRSSVITWFILPILRIGHHSIKLSSIIPKT